MKMFGKIQEYLSNPEVLVVLLIDEVRVRCRSIHYTHPVDELVERQLPPRAFSAN